MAPTATTSASATASPTCLDIAPGKNGYLPPEACGSLLFYEPSFGAAILFAVLFGLTTLAHTIQAVIYNKVRLFNLSQGTSTHSITALRMGSHHGRHVGALSIHFSGYADASAEQRRLGYYVRAIFSSCTHL